MAAPANDNFANAQTVTLTSGEYTSAAWDPTLATIEGGETGPNGTPIHTVWFKFTPAVGGTYTFDTGLSQGSEPDTIMSIYTGTALADLVRIASNNDVGTGGNSNYTSQVSNLALTAGTTYFIQVAAANGTQWLGPYVLHVKAGALDTPPAPSASYAATLAAVLPAFTARLGQAGRLPSFQASLNGVIQVVHATDLTYGNDGYGYHGESDADYDAPVASAPPHLARNDVRRIHVSLPTPTLVKGRPQ